MNFHQSFKKCSILTPDIRKLLYNYFKRQIKVQQNTCMSNWRGCTQVYGKILGGIPKMLVLYNLLKIMMVSDKTIRRAFRTHEHL